MIIVTSFDEVTGKCKWMWNEKWMGAIGAAGAVGWLVGLAFIPLVTMTVLYTRVIHTLWYKRNDHNELAYRQRVRVNNEQVFAR